MTRLICTELKSKHRLLFSPFPELSAISDQAAIAAKSQVADIEAKILKDEHAEAEGQSKDLAALALRGIDFYDTFDQNRLKWIVTSGYVSFALYTLIYTINTYGKTTRSPTHSCPPSPTLDAAIAVFSAVISALFVLEQTPWYCLYASFPVFFVRSLLQYQLGVSHVVGWTAETARRAAVLVSGVIGTLGVLFYIAVSSHRSAMYSSLNMCCADRLQRSSSMEPWIRSSRSVPLPGASSDESARKDCVDGLDGAMCIMGNVGRRKARERQDSVCVGYIRRVLQSLLVLHSAYAQWLYAATAVVCSYFAWRRTDSAVSVPAWLPASLTTILPMGSLIGRAIHSLQSKEGLSAARQLEAWMQLCKSTLPQLREDTNRAGPQSYPSVDSCLSVSSQARMRSNGFCSSRSPLLPTSCFSAPRGNPSSSSTLPPSCFAGCTWRSVVQR